MKKKQPKWKPIKMGERLPCQSFLRKKNGEILKLSTIGGVTVGQDAYYIPIDEVIEEIRNYPIEESEDEKIIKEIKQFIRSRGMSLAQSKVDSWIAWLEKQYEQKHQYNSRPRYVGEEELLGTNKQRECPFLKQELIDMGFAFTQDGDLAYPIHKIENKEFAAWSEEDESMLNFVKVVLNKHKDDAFFDKFKTTLNDCLTWFRNIKSRVGCEVNCTTTKEWSEEDKKMLDGIIEASTHHCYLNITDINWLKSLKDRVQPQPKQEWSEENEKSLCMCLCALGNPNYCYKNGELERMRNWLKSLRPQSQWKPSDGQMVALKCAITTADEKWVCMNTKDLESLYEDLKKLKE